MVQTDMQHWSIKTICDDSDCHVKEVEWKGDFKRFSRKE
jgi:hypothetical protein